jgi:addiction module RelB/DinJ family antitoxin
MAKTTIQIRIDEKTKKLATKKFKEAGMDLSTGIRCHLCDIAKSKNAHLRTVNGFMPEKEERLIKEGEWALKHAKMYKSIDELHRDILKS